MEEIRLVAEKREGRGTKKQLSAARAGAKVPGVIYGGDRPPVAVALAEKEILAVRRKAGVNAVIHLKVGGSLETVIIKALQRHPVSDRLVHADFQRISLTKKIEARVPLHVVGEAPGVKHEGGILQYELREIRVKALPTKIPQNIEVDISSLKMNDQLSVKDLRIPAEVEVLEDAEHLVVHVTSVKEEVAPAAVPAAAAAAPGAEGAAAAPAEPELSAQKGKKDEEGKPLPKEAKAAPAGKEAGKKEEKK